MNSIVWWLTVLALAAGLIWQVTLIVQIFAQKESVTSVTGVKVGNVLLPDMSWRANDRAFVNVLKDLGHSKMAELIAAQTHGLLEADFCPIAPVPTTTDLTDNPILDFSTMDVNEVIKDVKEKIGPPQKIITKVVGLKRGAVIQDITDKSTLLVTAAGPTFLLKTSEIDASRVDSVKVVYTLFDDQPLSAPFLNFTGGLMSEPQWYVHFGVDSVTTDNRIEETSVDGIGINAKATITFQVFERDGRYCGHAYTRSNLSCEGYCIVEKARKHQKCVPFLGEGVSYGDQTSLPLCGFNRAKECGELSRECAKECASCRTCERCRETKTTMVVQNVATEWDLSSYEVIFHLNSNSQVLVYSTKPTYEPVNMLAQIGGLFGVFFGLSIFSACQAAFQLKESWAKKKAEKKRGKETAHAEVDRRKDGWI